MSLSFRIGPIRPPSEANSLLLQVTNGCTWNKCKFCNLYKHTRFKAYSVDSIKADIDNMAHWRNLTLRFKNADGSFDLDGLNAAIFSCMPEDKNCFYMVANWLVSGSQTCFLQDGNTTILSGGKLSDVIVYLKEAIPEIKRITSYGRAENLAKVSADEFAELKKAGLDRIHSGFETGSDEVLLKINKGVTAEEEIRAGQNVKAGGIELSVYFMPGVGGKELTKENAIGTSDVINAVNPDFLRIRTAAVKPGTQLYEDYLNGDLTLCTEDEKVNEIRTVIERATTTDTVIVSDHMINLLQTIEGHLTKDKETLLGRIDDYLNMPNYDKKLFQIARRRMHVLNPSDIHLLPPQKLDHLKSILHRYETDEDFEQQLNEWIAHYI